MKMRLYLTVNPSASAISPLSRRLFPFTANDRLPHIWNVVLAHLLALTSQRARVRMSHRSPPPSDDLLSLHPLF